MAHEIESLFSVKETPWHGLGKVIADAPSVAEGIVLAGLNWGVSKEQLLCADGTATDSYAVRRDSDKSVLGVVGPQWTPLQNTEAFDWFQPFVDAKLATLQTAGSLRNGQRVWVLAEIAFEPSEIVKGDFVRKFMLLSNGHDGKLAVRVGFTPIRVVCANTLRASHESSASKLIRVRHNAGVKAKIDNLREIMNLANSEFEATADKYRFLASSMYNKDDVMKYVKKIVGIKENETDISTRKLNICKEIFDFINNGKGQDIPGVAGTWWAAYNGVTEYLNYSKGNNSDNRLNSLWFGQDHNLNMLALETCLEFANAA